MIIVTLQQTYKNYSYGDCTMSTLFVNNLNTASGSTITVPTGKKLVVTDTGGLSVPGTQWFNL